jgi:hypothetical protein
MDFITFWWEFNGIDMRYLIYLFFWNWYDDVFVFLSDLEFWSVFTNYMYTLLPIGGN